MESVQSHAQSSGPVAFGGLLANVNSSFGAGVTPALGGGGGTPAFGGGASQRTKKAGEHLAEVKHGFLELQTQVMGMLNDALQRIDQAQRENIELQQENFFLRQRGMQTKHRIVSSAMGSSVQSRRGSTQSNTSGHHSHFSSAVPPTVPEGPAEPSAPVLRRKSAFQHFSSLFQTGRSKDSSNSLTVDSVNIRPELHKQSSHQSVRFDVDDSGNVLSLPPGQCPSMAPSIVAPSEGSMPPLWLSQQSQGSVVVQNRSVSSAPPENVTASGPADSTAGATATAGLLSVNNSSTPAGSCSVTSWSRNAVVGNSDAEGGEHPPYESGAAVEAMKSLPLPNSLHVEIHGSVEEEDDESAFEGKDKVVSNCEHGSAVAAAIQTMQTTGVDYQPLAFWKETFSDVNEAPVHYGATWLSSGHTWAKAHAQEDNAERPVRRVLLDPSSAVRAVWDVVSCLLILYDLIVIPMDFLALEENLLIFQVGTWLTRLFWTADIGMSLMTGFTKDNGVIEMRVWPVFKKYLMTWFVLDVCLIGLDWTVLVLESGSGAGYARLGKATVRIVRVMRMIRLVRIARLSVLYQFFTETVASERLLIMVGVMRSGLLVLALSHVTACLWYGLAVAQESNNWIDHGFADDPIGTRYAMALHWSLSQLTGGMDEVTPECVQERLFAITVCIISFVGSVFLVSTWTSSMTQLHIVGSSEAQKLAVLRDFLGQHGVSKDLVLRVVRNSRHRIRQERRQTPETRVELLTRVSEPLRAEIHYEMYSGTLRRHVMFDEFAHNSPGLLLRLCHTASSILRFSAGDTVFQTGEVPSPPQMFVALPGACMQYACAQVTDPNACSEDEFESEDGVNDGWFQVLENQWIAEATLWTRWVHVGDLITTQESRLYSFDVHTFLEIFRSYQHLAALPKTYASKFVKKMNSLEEGPNDLFTLEEDLSRSASTASRRAALI
uniref:Ion transport domain-containing protein n=1 Tax=Zooxanthella nutricula TaxID=1333877 RepID=A0A7S2QJZ4_9DINO